ncbi:type II toxin-antitoxin system RatA family toxin [Psychromonas antarctica]|jgi:ribosome-associated toxin RatA of RatAB toxin-antitoxin module|uniref:type II toxin-antitoxin system RatA family toxin n=1 Tax=Psychromonas antarctica TaxID=67573 RepID=UPI001EE877C1|nr:type II toxin-antitoxin system RatA family toxin [Psychromonas antarctica]MCG6201541.1 type II toxin-antitoxin system RatA family toxin [Psychromonas antarctica]
MAEVSRSALLMYSADEMYQLVNDVCAYPEFLSGCVDANILFSSEHVMRAVLKVSKAGISQTFTTENRLVDGRTIDMHLVNGPFKNLSGGWTFTALDETACKVSLDLKFEFSSSLVELAFGRIFNEMIGSMVKSFAARAKVIYGIR